jgi:hypothetical protein
MPPTAQLFFAMHAVDLLAAMLHPFSLDSQNLRRSHAAVWLTAGASGVLLAANDVYGPVGAAGLLRAARGRARARGRERGCARRL